MANQKLELTWVEKNKPVKLEPRLLLEIPEKSYHAKTKRKGDIFENMLIHGDNLLTLKALEMKFSKKVRCIYIDPPYNTGVAFEHYDDNLEHSIWLNLMRMRLSILRNLLRDDGVIWIQIDDEEQAYLKVLCDEVFGRANFVNMISVNMKNNAGASGGGEDKRLKKNCEFILVYAKDYEKLPIFKSAYQYTEMYEVVKQYKAEGKNWHYTSVLVNPGTKEYVCSTVDGDGNEIKIYRRVGTVIKSVKQLMSDEKLTEKDVYYKYGESIFEAKDAQSSIRQRVIAAKKENDINDDIISIEYVPKTGKNRGQLYEQFYKGDACRLFAWLRDISTTIDGVLYKKNKLGTYWDFTSSINNLTKEGNVVFPNGKKPEKLVSQILSMCTEPGDLVLDSFLGSGTTAAVAHKMRRRWIGVELGAHCNTHCIPRLKSVVDGEDKGGISKDVNWLGGGGFRFYELAPSLIKKDEYGMSVIDSEHFDDVRLAEAVCKIMGFDYAPSKDEYFIHGQSTENAFIYVTTNFMTVEHIQSISRKLGGRHLSILCKAFEPVPADCENVMVKKIPKEILEKCEWGKDDYSLKIKELPVAEEQESDDLTLL